MQKLYGIQTPVLAHENTLCFYIFMAPYRGGVRDMSSIMSFMELYLEA